MKIIYEVVDNGVDGWANYRVGLFESENDAHIVAKNETSYGQGSVRKMQIFESLDSYEAYKKESALNGAKGKLTKEEMELLGL